MRLSCTSLRSDGRAKALARLLRYAPALRVTRLARGGSEGP